MKRSLPGIMVAAAAGIVVAHLCFLIVGCASQAQTHQSVETAAYAADDAVCVAEAADKDGGLACLDKYKQLYAPFWADAGDASK